LGLPTPIREHTYEVDWQAFRRIMHDDDTLANIDAVADQAQKSGAEVVHPNRRLRHLDAILWMRPRRTTR
jgi:hypothetical protein